MAFDIEHPVQACMSPINSDQRTSLRTTKPRTVPRTTNTMLGLKQYPQRVLLHKQQKRPRTFLANLKYVAAQQPTDRQFRYSNRPIRCSTQLSRYYGRYHEQICVSSGVLIFFNPRMESSNECYEARWLLRMRREGPP